MTHSHYHAHRIVLSSPEHPVASVDVVGHGHWHAHPLPYREGASHEKHRHGDDNAPVPGAEIEPIGVTLAPVLALCKTKHPAKRRRKS